MLQNDGMIFVHYNVQTILFVLDTAWHLWAYVKVIMKPQGQGYEIRRSWNVLFSNKPQPTYHPHLYLFQIVYIKMIKLWIKDMGIKIIICYDYNDGNWHLEGYSTNVTNTYGLALGYTLI